MTVQTELDPLSSNEDFNSYKASLARSDKKYDNVGILLDDPIGNMILILFSHELIVDLFRMNFEARDFSNKAFDFSFSEVIEIRAIQGKSITTKEVISIDSIQVIWEQARCQKRCVNKEQLEEHISLIWDEKYKGRSKNFSEKTKRLVIEASHGRCMYQGCGLKLTVDETTGIEGNYGYLAHNVASSEQGPRGVKVMSETLANDPNNVLLLCDQHHRLIDKIAVVDHPAHLLSTMRDKFIELAENLLDGLKYQPCLTFSILFPVRQNIIQKPTSMQIASSLAINYLRQSGSLLDLVSNETSHSDETNEQYWPLMKSAILRVSDKIISHCIHEKINVAIYALGSMPTLIALGATLGNKRGYIPILYNRQLGHWGWSKQRKEKDFFMIKNLEELNDNEEEVIISFAFTAEPGAFKQVLQETNKTKNIKQIEVVGREFNNDCLSHPDAGNYFSNKLQTLFHKLREKNNVHKIHILPCMSNAASIYLGMAIDRHHPDFLLYEYADTEDGFKTMIPVLSICSRDGKTIVECCDKV